MSIDMIVILAFFFFSCSKGALGLLSIPSALVFLAGVLLKERRVTDFDYKQVRMSRQNLNTFPFVC
jgi:hypothetical protein